MLSRAAGSGTLPSCAVQCGSTAALPCGSSTIGRGVEAKQKRVEVLAALSVEQGSVSSRDNYADTPDLSSNGGLRASGVQICILRNLC